MHATDTVRVATGMGPASVNTTLRNITINGTPIAIRVVSDDQAEDMQLAYRLWYEVYVEELRYPLTEGVDHEARTLMVPPNGSIVFMAVADGECVGTIRTTHSSIAPLEFDYGQWLPNEPLAELTKLVVKKKLRNSLLTAQIMVETYAYHETILPTHPYKWLVCNTTPKLFDFYQLFGWKKIHNEILLHPVIGNRSNVLKCPKSRFITTVNELHLLIASNPLTKTKWALRYWWYKKMA